MGINKNGTAKFNDFKESYGSSILENSYIYTPEAPYSLTGTSGDIIYTTTLYSKVNPNQTYYLCADCTSWSDGHGYSDARKGKGTIWLYLSTEYNPSNMGYNTPVCFTSSNWIQPGVWRYTMSNTANMARIRLNTYSNGTDSVTCKFWNIRLIPEKYYKAHMGKDFISATDFYEI